MISQFARELKRQRDKNDEEQESYSLLAGTFSPSNHSELIDGINMISQKSLPYLVSLFQDPVPKVKVAALMSVTKLVWIALTLSS